MQIVRYISDLHLFDVYSLEWRDNFSSLEEYARHLIFNWNQAVDDEDVTIIVGDIGYNCSMTYNALNALNGKKVLVLGNHDIEWRSDVYKCKLFSGIHSDITSNGIYINHLPSMLHSGYQYYIHGHHHRYDVPGMYSQLLQYARDTYRLNCCADLINNRPCTLQELQLNKELLLDKYRRIGYIKEE